ncbi:phosphate regulon sensor histidine kinase PhoR [Betaproteobacteria bacterium]|nr:phosphate regulon sensor histidine kinase PhoR [Betaproteobacteria bacterium]GHU44873.1 phosphate regulon sensor histidine kinase PhoR [Betaproteobacteria bacterium]
MSFFLILRLSALLLWLGAGALIFCSVGESAFCVWFGASLGIVCWFLIDYRAIVATLRWLYRLQEDPQLAPPPLRGFWLELIVSFQRPLRQQIRRAKEAENNLKNLQAALQASPNGVIVLDEKNCIEWFNQTASRHLGLKPIRDIAQPIPHLLRSPEFSDYLNNRDFDKPLELQSPASTPARPLKLSIQVCAYASDRRLMLTEDITLQQQTEIMRRDFVANASHEIRTPLTVLIGFIETLQTLPQDESQQKYYLAMMERQAKRMQSLVSDLLTLSRLENSPPPDFQTWNSVRVLLDHCETDARVLSQTLTQNMDALPHKISFPADIPANAALAGSEKELFSLFTNLVFNAVRYTPPGGNIEISWTSPPKGGALFSVKDSGQGIPAEHIPRLTERFYRVDRSRSHETGGTGLGLSIVKHILIRHNATLSIESAPGHGACFTVQFPARHYRATSPDVDSAL